MCWHKLFFFNYFFSELKVGIINLKINSLSWDMQFASYEWCLNWNNLCTHRKKFLSSMLLLITNSSVWSLTGLLMRGGKVGVRVSWPWNTLSPRWMPRDSVLKERAGPRPRPRPPIEWNLQVGLVIVVNISSLLSQCIFQNWQYLFSGSRNISLIVSSKIVQPL